MTIVSHVFTNEGSGLQFDLSSVFVRPDGSFVITWTNSPFGSVPYHVPDNEEFHGMYAELVEYRKVHPECFSPDPDFQEPSLDDLKAAKAAQIDAETSAAIASGFVYAVGGVTRTRRCSAAGNVKRLWRPRPRRKRLKPHDLRKTHPHRLRSVPQHPLHGLA